MADSFETCRDYRATIPLSLLKISELCDILSRLYESLNEKNRMCDVDKTHMKHGRRQQHVHLQLIRDILSTRLARNMVEDSNTYC